MGSSVKSSRTKSINSSKMEMSDSESGFSPKKSKTEVEYHPNELSSKTKSEMSVKSEKSEKAKSVTMTMAPMSMKDFQQKGKLMKGDTLTLELDEVEQYLENKESMENLKEEEHRTPFIIYLNSKFTSQVKSNRRSRQVRKMTFYMIAALILITIGVVLSQVFSSVFVGKK